MRAIVTGGAGFIGSNLVDALVKKNIKVTVIDNLSTGQTKNLKKSISKIKFVKIDISKQTRKLESLFKNVDFVFHLAGLADIVPSIKNPKKYFEANVNGTLNVLKLVRIKRLKNLFMLPPRVLWIADFFPTSENAKIDTKYPYALTKFLGEKLVMHYASIFKMPNISLRFFNVYGLRSRTTGAYGAVFGVFLAQKISNKPLTVVGSGKQTRDFVHVTDLVHAIIKTARSKIENKIFNVGSGKETTVNKIANLIGGKKFLFQKDQESPIDHVLISQKFARR